MDRRSFLQRIPLLGLLGLSRCEPAFASNSRYTLGSATISLRVEVLEPVPIGKTFGMNGRTWIVTSADYVYRYGDWIHTDIEAREIFPHPMRVVAVNNVHSVIRDLV